MREKASLISLTMVASHVTYAYSGILNRLGLDQGEDSFG